MFEQKEKIRNYGLNGNAPISNHKCKANSIRLINRKVCRNNCKHYNHVKNPDKKSCEFGYK